MFLNNQSLDMNLSFFFTCHLSESFHIVSKRFSAMSERKNMLCKGRKCQNPVFFTLKEHVRRDEWKWAMDLNEDPTLTKPRAEGKCLHR